MNKILKKISLIMLIAMQIIAFESCGPKNGLIRENGNTFFYVNGEMQVGWQKINNKWHFFYQTDHDSTGEYIEKGSMKYDSWLKHGADYYHFDDKGNMQTGWQNIDNNWYYLGDDGKMRINSWVDNQYYVNNDGQMIIDDWVNDDNYSYYFGGDGKVDMSKSKQRVKNKPNLNVESESSLKEKRKNASTWMRNGNYSSQVASEPFEKMADCYDFLYELEYSGDYSYSSLMTYGYLIKNTADAAMDQAIAISSYLTRNEGSAITSLWELFSKIGNDCINGKYKGYGAYIK